MIENEIYNIIIKLINPSNVENSTPVATPRVGITYGHFKYSSELLIYACGIIKVY